IERIHGKGMNDSFTGLRLAFVLHDESRDVVVDAAAAADTTLVMTGFTGGGIEHRTEAIATLSQHIARFPVMIEQRFSCPRHVVIDFRMTRRPPSQHAESSGK